MHIYIGLRLQNQLYGGLFGNNPLFCFRVKKRVGLMLTEKSMLLAEGTLQVVILLCRGVVF